MGMLNYFSGLNRIGRATSSTVRQLASREAVRRSVPRVASMVYETGGRSGLGAFSTLERAGITAPLVGRRALDVSGRAIRSIGSGIGAGTGQVGASLSYFGGMPGRAVGNVSRGVGAFNARTSGGLLGFTRGVAGGVIRGGLLYGAGESLQDLGDHMGGVSGALIGTVGGFGFKAAGLRAGVGGVIRGARMGTSQWSGGMRSGRMPKGTYGPGSPMRTMRSYIAQGARKLEGSYQRFAYDMPRKLLTGAGSRGGGLLGKGALNAAAFPVTAPLKMGKGMLDIGGAYLGGMRDIMRGGKGPGFIGRAFTQPKNINALNRKRPLWGMFGMGAVLGGPTAMMPRYAGGGKFAPSDPRDPGGVAGGINPANYGGGVNFEGARGMRRNLTMGSSAVAQRMVSMRR